MSTYADGSVIISIDADGKLAIKELENTEKELSKVGDSSENAASGMQTLSVGAAAVATALVALGAAALRAGSEFDAAFAKTQTIMDNTAVSTQQMSTEILELSEKSAVAATNVSDAVYQAISGSVNTADAVGFVSDANKLAIAGFTSLTNATDVLTTALNAYGLDADSVAGISNVLIQTQNLGKTSVDELSASIGRAIATGSAYGVNLQNVSAAYVELTRGGIATAEATTYLSGMLNELGKADSNVATILREQTGKTFGELMASGASLADVLQVLSNKVDGNAEAMMGLWGSQEAAKAANAVMTMGVTDFNDVLGQMNDEMQGTTGTTEAAYKTMTQTSAFIDNRLQNSVTNLGIAVGEQLAPTVDAVKTALAGFVEGITEFAGESPLLTSAVVAIAVAAGVLAVGLGGYTIATKLATSATLKMTAAMATNPYFLAITAVAALAAGIVALATSSNNAVESVEDLTTAASALADGMDTEMEACEQSVASTLVAAETADGYIDRLEELETVESLSAEQERERHNLLLLLAQTIPEVADKIDLETDSIEGGTKALRDCTDAWAENAKAQAYQDYITQAAQKQADALIEVKENELMLAEQQQKQAALSEKRIAIEAKLAAMRQASAEQAAAFNAENNASLNENAFLTDEYYQLEASLEGVNSEYLITTQQIENCQDAIVAGKKAVADATEDVEYAEKVVRGMTIEMSAGTEAMSAQEQEIADYTSAWETASSELSTAYDTARAAASESIEKQIGLFEDMTLEASVSASSIIASLDSQIAYMDTYAANMASAAARGVDDGLLAKLNDGSKQSAEILAALATATDAQIKEINEKYAGVGEKKDEFADGLAEYEGEVLAAKDNMVSLMGEAGMDMSNELTQSLLDGYPAFLDALKLYLGDSVSAPEALPVVHPGNDGGSRGGVVRAMYADGCDRAARGVALVGENGPELVYFSGGEQVLTAEQTRSTLQSVYPAAPDMQLPGATAPAAVGRTAQQLQITLVAPLTVDGREFARATAEYIGEEMEFEVM